MRQGTYFLNLTFHNAEHNFPQELSFMELVDYVMAILVSVDLTSVTGFIQWNFFFAFFFEVKTQCGQEILLVVTNALVTSSHLSHTH
jgi:multisubunit Na+/H+ antiporter MnhB subunit